MLVTTLLAFSAFAQEKPEKEEPKFPIVKLSGVIFPSYGVDLTGLGTNAGPSLANEFDVKRVYLRTDVQMSKRFAMRVTLDADHMKPAVLATGEEVTYDTKYRVFVKHAYLEAKDLGPFKVRAGIVDSPYTSFYDGFWGNRYITEAFAKNAGQLETADLGVSLLGEHADGLVDWNLSVLNGEGYSKLEVDAGKSVQGRVTIDPLAKPKDAALPITGFAAWNDHPTDGTSTLTWGASAGVEIPRFLGWVEVLGSSEDGTSGLGFSGTLNPRLPKYAGLVVRFDHWDPDAAAQGDGENLLIAGIEKDFHEKVSFALTYEREWVDATPDAAEHGIVLHAMAGF